MKVYSKTPPITAVLEKRMQVEDADDMAQGDDRSQSTSKITDITID